METAVILSNFVSSSAIVTVAGFFCKRWMDAKDATDIGIANDLKHTIADHKKEIKDATEALNRQLESIHDQLRIANGRTARLEGGIIKIEAVCAERHKGDRRHVDG